MAEREQFEQTSTERLAKRIRDILGPYNDDTESLQNLISKLVLEREEYFDRIGQLEQAARAAPALPQIPDGMALVPVEPTEAMLVAARDWSYKKYSKPIGNDAAQGCWQAMLAATKEKGE